MFGPDKCGNDFKLHFIFRHVNPLTEEIEEKHAKVSINHTSLLLISCVPYLYKICFMMD